MLAATLAAVVSLALAGGASAATMAPVCSDQTVVVPVGTVSQITLACANGGSLTLMTVTPTHGTLSPPNGAVVSYTPDAGYSGPDSFTFTATDTQGRPSNAATVSIVVGPPVNTGLPTIAGTAVAGQTLTEAHGSWSGSPTSFAYQWGRCDATGGACSAVAGATAQTYAVTAADVGSTIRVLETASNANGPGAAAVSTQTAVVAPPPSPPVNTTRPMISGQPYVGAALSCSTGTWTGTPPITYSFQWFGDGSAFVGATGSTYQTTVNNLALAFTCAVTATNSAGSATAESAPLLVTSPPACFMLAGGPLARCRAGAAYHAALAKCHRITARTPAGRGRRSACLAAAKLSYKRAAASAKCKALTSAHKRATCLARARAIKK